MKHSLVKLVVWATTLKPPARRIRTIWGVLREFAPYAAIELILPGGTVLAILCWLYRKRGSAANVRRAPRTPVRCLLACIAQLTVGTAASARAVPPPAPSPPASQDAEISLALSACPRAVAKGAGVYVLGFNALVQHSLPQAQEPRCMGAEGTRTWLPRILKVAELRAEGKSREEIQHIIADALAKGVLQPPTRPGVDYMLSTQNRVPNTRGEVTPFPPHVMFYAPYLTNADIGVDNAKLGGDGNPMGPAFVAAEETPYALIIVPVGSHPAMTHATADFSSGDAEVDGNKSSTATGRNQAVRLQCACKASGSHPPPKALKTAI